MTMTIELLDKQHVPRLGAGCWAIGGPLWAGETPMGWGEVDDAESTRALHAAYDNGIRFFDTADIYGAGHSERIVGAALKGRPDIIIGTKFGNMFDETTRKHLGGNTEASYVRRAAEASLKRLGCDRIDLLQLHHNELPINEAAPVRDALEALVEDGLVKAYGWSTDWAERAASWVGAPNYRTVQHDLNIMNPASDLLAVIEANNLVSINRSPLAMGFLSGKFKAGHKFSDNDIRGTSVEWLKPFKDGALNPDYVKRLDAVKDLLTVGGRTLTQGALAWIWAASDRTLPIPGFRTVEQATENAGALSFGPLPADTFAEINKILGHTA